MSHSNPNYGNSHLQHGTISTTTLDSATPKHKDGDFDRKMKRSTSRNELTHWFDRQEKEELSQQKRNRKQKKKIPRPFPHAPVPREPLLEKVLDKHKETFQSPDNFSNTLAALQHEDFQGLVNLGFMILVAASLQLLVNNYMKHGLQMDIKVFQCILNDFTPAFFLGGGITTWSLSTFIIQKLIVQDKISPSTARILHAVTLFILFTAPIRIIFLFQMTPLVAGPLAMSICILAMKMHSYFHTNQLLAEHFHHTHHHDQPGSPQPSTRPGTELQKSDSFGKLLDSTESVDEDHAEEYPNNVTLGGYIYFMFVPTLVYETKYPSTPSVNHGYVLKEGLVFWLCVFIATVILTQFILPTIKESIPIPVMLLKLTIPSIIVWLVGFYAFFHCFLNLLSELLQYADREFYKDWWNSPSLDIFWRKWNILVHEWLLRHIFITSMKAKASKQTATLLTFLISAILHEFVFWVGFRVIRPWFFFGMFAQVPLILLSKVISTVLPPVNAKRWGNIFVWCSLFLGQPMIEILYIREFFEENADFFCVHSH